MPFRNWFMGWPLYVNFPKLMQVTDNSNKNNTLQPDYFNNKQHGLGAIFHHALNVLVETL